MDLKDIINGTCRKAINDERGNNILETYQKKLGIGEFIGNIDLISKNSVCLCWSIKCEGTFPLDNMVCILKTENYEEAGDTQAFVFQTALPVDGKNEGRCFIRKKDLVGDEVSASDWHEIPSDATINKFEINFDSEDDENPVAWTSMRKIVSGKIKDLFGNVSIMAKNIRWLYKMLGTTNIASIGGGTLTGAISKLNTDISILPELLRYGAERTLNLGSTGGWYRLGYLEGTSAFYGEFRLWHYFSYIPSEFFRFIIGGAGTRGEYSDLAIQKIFSTAFDNAEKTSLRKIRVLYGGEGGKFYIDVYLRDFWGGSGTRENTWAYALTRCGIYAGNWVDGNFEKATMPEGYVSKEIPFV